MQSAMAGGRIAAVGLLALLLVVPGCLGPSSTPAACPGPSCARDAGALEYHNGFTAQGAFEGECAARGLRFTPADGATFTATTDTIEVAVVREWYNETVLLPDVVNHGGLPIQRDVHLKVERAEAGPGPVTVEWNRDSFAWLDRNAFGEALGPDRPASFNATLVGTEWAAAPAARFFSIGAWGIWYALATPDGRYNGSLKPVLWGPARIVTTNQALVPLAGDAYLTMHHGRIQADGLDIRLPPFAQLVREQYAGAAAQRMWLFTYAVVGLHGFEARVPADAGDLVCDALRWSGHGTVTFRHANGTVERGPERVEFDRRELTINGTLDSVETMRQFPGPSTEPARAVASVRGEFRTVGIDFQAVPAPDASSDVLPRLGLAALALGAAGWLASHASKGVALLYTRTSRHKALDHPTRALIHELAGQQPGLHLRALAKAVGRPYGVVRHHTGVLAHLGLVTTLRHGLSLRVYPADTNRRSARRALVQATDPKVRYLWEQAGPNPLTTAGASQTLRHHFGLSRVGAWKVIRRAERAGLVARTTGPEGVRLCRAS